MSSSHLNLTPVQRHYLIKVLSQMEMEKEWGHLERLGALTKYGNPFTHERPPLKKLKAQLDKAEKEYVSKKNLGDGDGAEFNDSETAHQFETPDSVLLRHLFHTHLRTVPGLDEAPDTYFNERWQPLFDEAALRSFSHSEERAELSKRRFYPILTTRYLGAFVARGIGIRGEGELRGPGPGVPGSEAWDVGKKWGAGTCKRGLAHPIRIDAALMAKIDSLFQGTEGEAWKRAGAETKRVRSGWQQWKESIVEDETGLEKTFNQLDIANMKNLPLQYKNAAEFARNFAAEWMRYFVVVQPGADELFSALKIMHTLFPYKGAILLLQVANAQKVIAGILAILLARPAGMPSLVQRVVSAIVNSQAKDLEKKKIKPLRQLIADPRITNAIDGYVSRGSWTEKLTIQKEAQEKSRDVLTIILLRASAVPEPELTQLEKACIASPLLGDLDLAYPPDCLPPAERRTPPNLSATDGQLALKFAQSKLYLRNVLKKRDREQAAAVANSSLIPATIKDTLNAVFYKAIAIIARHANLASRLADLQAFNNDAINVRMKSQNTRADWIALAARHEQSLYFFFHEMSTIIEPFARWCQYGVDYMSLSTTDPVHPGNDDAKRIEVNVEELLVKSGLGEDRIAQVIKEVDSVATFTLYSKVRAELETRRNYLSALKDAVPSSGLSREDVPTEAMRKRIEDIDGLLLELMHAEGIQPEDGVCRSPARGTEAEPFPWAYFGRPDPCGQQLTANLRAQNGIEPPRFDPSETSAPIPALSAIRELLPSFVQVLQDAVPDWEHGTKNYPGQAGPRGELASLARSQTGTASSIQTGTMRAKSGGGLGRLFKGKKANK
ncbi:hypothetical protein OC846_003582 [Tilletia horrida]|uniref:Uncharacterized protein n=1 Tax=Tilletia horrida TaxID=155126 RepID=A0AAN6JXU4_9BASI|nr:hypothetical protein OC846_003582 [Tilletia horrida]KAK0569595.1 hypothetical protein OC861_000775 [Tilletia horrida]